MTIVLSRRVALIAFAVQMAVSPASAQTGDKPVGILLAAGDISTCGGATWHRYADRTADIIRGIVKEALQAQPPVPVKVLALGDLAYGKGTKEQFDCYAARWSGFEEIVFPVPGNHEYLTAAAAPYFERFRNNPNVKSMTPYQGYAAVRFPDEKGPWHLIGLNSELRGQALALQLQWLNGQLGNASKDPSSRCILAFWHRPTFASGRHGHNYKTDKNQPLTKNRPMQKALRMLHGRGASVVLAGHEHNYEQFKRHDADGKQVPDGLRSFVVGTGGSLLTEDGYTKVLAISEGLYGKDRLGNGRQGILKLVLFERHYEWQFVSIDAKFTLPLKTTRDGCNTLK